MKMNSKKIAGEKAAEFVKDGMIVGLGTGSTIYYTILKLSERIKEGLKITAVSTSNSTTELAKKMGIRISPFNEVDYVDLTIDGADEVDDLLNGIKGGGGALLFEKLVAVASKKVIWVVDENKVVPTLGKFPLPIEVVPFGYHQILNKFQFMGYNPVIRKSKENKYYSTDGHHYIIDLFMKSIDNPKKLEKTIMDITGVVETGLFLNIADTIIIGRENSVEVINK